MIAQYQSTSSDFRQKYSLASYSDELIMAQYINRDMTNSAYVIPCDIIKARNRSIYLSVVEIVFSIVSLIMSSVLLPSSQTVLVAAIVSLMSNILGLFWRVRFNFTGLSIHLVL